MNKCILFISIIAILTSCGKGYKEKTDEESNYYTKTGEYGIDLSHHNAEPDWSQLDVDFVVLKATEGTDYVDPTYNNRCNRARRHNIPVGAYHYFTGRNEGIDEFKNYYNTVGFNIDIIPIIDVEVIPKGVSKKSFQDNLIIFIKSCIDTYGKFPIIYTSEWFYNKYLESKLSSNFCMDYMLWFGDIDKDYNTFNTYPEIHQSTIAKVRGTQYKVDVDELHVPLTKIMFRE